MNYVYINREKIIATRGNVIMSNTVIFKTFSTYAHHYVYDRHTNAVVMLTDDEYKELVAVEKGEVAAEESVVIKRYQEQGLFQPNVVQRIEHSGTNRLEAYLKTRTQQLTLQVTQQCNLRCAYCAYSGIYENNRTHNSARMSFDVAKKAIDYFLEHNTHLADVVIGFYGGEPLLEFELIKKCVEYANSKVEGKKILFNMTTNGTLLSDKVVDFLSRYNFSISISLDGSKEEHDRNRKFKDGRGSFDVIIENLRNIREKYLELDKRIQIMTTINPHMDLGCVMEYFSADEVLNDKNILFNTMNEKDLKNAVSYDESYYEIRNFEYIKCLFSVVGKLERKYTSALAVRSMDGLKQMRSRTHAHASLTRLAHHNGPCLPGVRKLFVRTDGKFYPCERVNETQEYFCVGSVDTGVCVDECKKILNIGKITEKQCKQCWALRHCSLCAGQIEFTDEPQVCDKLKHCNVAKRQALFDLKELCVMKEFGISDDELGVFI